MNAKEVAKSLPNYIVWASDEDATYKKLNFFGHSARHLFLSPYTVNKRDSAFLYNLLSKTTDALSLPRGLFVDTASLCRVPEEPERFFVSHCVLLFAASYTLQYTTWDKFSEHPIVAGSGMSLQDMLMVATQYRARLLYTTDENSARMEAEIYSPAMVVTCGQSVTADDVSDSVLDAAFRCSNQVVNVNEFFDGMTFSDLVGGDRAAARECIASAATACARLTEIVVAQIEKLACLHVKSV